MCGILGWYGLNISEDRSLNALRLLGHRGPDCEGTWQNETEKIWLGHKRLSIIDLTINATQPMRSKDGNYVLIFNGEIYNYRSLKIELEAGGYNFTTSSDTEVLLAAIEEWGIKQTLEKINGMFAFAIWNNIEKALTIARDRMGIKPLYWFSEGNSIAFASEIDALLEIVDTRKSIDLKSVDEYFSFLCCQAPNTIYQDIQVLEPGNMLTVEEKGIQTHKYWDHAEIVKSGIKASVGYTYKKAKSELKRNLEKAVELEINSDVPCGSFLSGGIDSTLVTALVNKLSDKPISTFTISFPGTSNDEAIYANKIADFLGTNHYERTVGPEDALQNIDKMIQIYGEPFADGSSIPTYLLSQFAAKYIKVAFSGDGGDELFGGYPRYYWANRIEQIQSIFGIDLTNRVGKILSAIPAEVMALPLDIVTMGKYRGSHGVRPRISRFAKFLMSNRNNFDSLMIASCDLKDISNLNSKGDLRTRSKVYDDLSWPDQMMAIDQVTYLPNDILTKTDRASMANSLEVRVPLLNQLVVENAWKIKQTYKFQSRGDSGKLILRDILKDYVPTDLTERPKKGFGMPMSIWLRDELKPWAEEILSKDSIESTNILRYEAVEQIWHQHLSGKDQLSKLWPIMMYTLWYKESLKR